MSVKLFQAIVKVNNLCYLSAVSVKNMPSVNVHRLSDSHSTAKSFDLQKAEIILLTEGTC